MTATLTKKQKSRLPSRCYVWDEGVPTSAAGHRFKVCEPFIMGQIIRGKGNTVDEAIADALKGRLKKSAERVPA
jgi:hypothetical protein